jgi:hypothetical protein
VKCPVGVSGCRKSQNETGENMTEYRVMWGKLYLTGFNPDTGVPIWHLDYSKARTYSDYETVTIAKTNAIKDFPSAHKAINVVSITRSRYLFACE